MKVRRPNLEALYKEVDNYIPAKESLQPPRIGISANRRDGLSCIAETYVQAVLDAGGAPVLIPVITDLKALTVLVSELDGLVMSGGGDINPLYLHEEPIPQLQDVDTLRDEYDLILLRLPLTDKFRSWVFAEASDHECSVRRKCLSRHPFTSRSTAIETQPDIGAGISVAYGNSRTGNEPATRYFQWRRTNPCQLFPPSSGKRGRPRI